MGRPRNDGRPGQKKVKDPNKPKRSTSAYFYFLASCRDQAKKQGRSISKIAEFTKECSEKWREMDSKTKEPFEKKAALDKVRYDREMENYGGGSGKAKKDPNQPKKPLTGYFHFLANFRETHKGEDIPNKELLKMAGETWREMDDSEKLPFEQKSQAEQKKYETAMQEYRRTGGVPKSNGGANAVVDDDEEEDEDEDEEDDE